MLRKERLFYRLVQLHLVWLALVQCGPKAKRFVSPMACCVTTK